MKLKPSIYRRAAEAIADGREVFACNAIGRRADRSCTYNIPEVQFFLKMFAPDGTYKGAAFYSSGAQHGRCVSEYKYEHDSARMIAILLCEIFAKEQNRRK